MRKAEKGLTLLLPPKKDKLVWRTSNLERFPTGATDSATNTSWTEAAKIVSDVWKNEETRFASLNTRGVAVVSATSLVTAILGFFAKDFVDSTGTGLSNRVHSDAENLLLASLVLLVLTALIVVLGVLRPGHRFVFGENVLTSGTGADGLLTGDPAIPDSAGTDNPPKGALRAHAGSDCALSV
jgi:hypothetical protein